VCGLTRACVVCGASQVHAHVAARVARRELQAASPQSSSDSLWQSDECAAAQTNLMAQPPACLGYVSSMMYAPSSIRLGLENLFCPV
jgi:hypothetical protein